MSLVPQRPSLLTYPGRFQKNPGRTIVRPTVSGSRLGTPATPTGLAIANQVGSSGTQYAVALSWTEPAGAAVDVFEIQRKTGAGGTFATIGYAPSTGLAGTSYGGTYTDNVSTIGQYYYQIRARNTTGQSAWSAAAGPADGGCAIASSQQSGTAVRQVKAAGGDTGALAVYIYSAVVDSYDDGATGIKTVIGFANPIDAVQGAMNGPGDLSQCWSLISGCWDNSPVAAQGCFGIGVPNGGAYGAMSVKVRAQYITAAFAVGTLTWAGLAGLTLSGHIDEFQVAAGWYDTHGSMCSSTVPLLAPLLLGSVGATIYGMILSAKLHDAPTVGSLASGNATCNWNPFGNPAIILARNTALFGSGG